MLRKGALVSALFLSCSVVADDGQVALRDYLLRAKAAGFNIIYASSVVTSAQTITDRPDADFSLEHLRQQLGPLNLDLEQVGANSFLLKAAQTRECPTKAATSTGSQIEEVVVHSSRYQWSQHGTGAALFSNDQLTHRPVLANDALRVVNQLPGSASVGLSARPRVRGGHENETLIEFDSVRLYNPFHFESYNSLNSVFDQRLLGEVEFFSGTYPLYLGDSLSAAMSLRPPDADTLTDYQEVGVGIYQLSYFYSGVNADDSLLFSLRRSSPEAGHLLESQDLGHPEYIDSYLRYQWDAPSGQRYAANLLWYGDDLSLGSDATGEEAEANYSSAYAWLRTDSSVSDALQWSATFGLGYLKNERAGEVDQPAKVRGNLTERIEQLAVFVNQDFTLENHQRSLAFGWELRHLDAEFETNSLRFIDPAFAAIGNITRETYESFRGSERGQQAALYVIAKQRINEQLIADAGLRVDVQSIADDDAITPAFRLGLLYQPHETVDLRAAWGRYTQAQAQALNDLPIADLETTIASPQKGNQMVLSVDWALPVLQADVKAEVYRKDIESVNSYYDNLSNAFTLLPELQPDRVRISPQRYRADGIELSVEIPVGSGMVWANYAYATAKDRIDGTFIERSWDQGRTFNGGFQFAMADWELALSASFHEGWLSTPLMLSGDEVTAGPRNSERFDHFLSIDAKAIRRYRFRYGELRLEMGISNLSDRENQVGTDYQIVEGAARETPFYGVSRTGFIDVFWSF